MLPLVCDSQLSSKHQLHGSLKGPRLPEGPCDGKQKGFQVGGVVKVEAEIKGNSFFFKFREVAASKKPNPNKGHVYVQTG